MTQEWEELESDEEDELHTEEGRERQVDDDEIEDWEGAWTQGYDEG